MGWVLGRLGFSTGDLVPAMPAQRSAVRVLALDLLAVGRWKPWKWASFSGHSVVMLRSLMLLGFSIIMKLQLFQGIVRVFFLSCFHVLFCFALKILDIAKVVLLFRRNSTEYTRSILKAGRVWEAVIQKDMD